MASILYIYIYIYLYIYKIIHSWSRPDLVGMLVLTCYIIQGPLLLPVGANTSAECRALLPLLLSTNIDCDDDRRWCHAAGDCSWFVRVCSSEIGVWFIFIICLKPRICNDDLRIISGVSPLVLRGLTSVRIRWVLILKARFREACLLSFPCSHTTRGEHWFLRRLQGLFIIPPV